MQGVNRHICFADAAECVSNEVINRQVTVQVVIHKFWNVGAAFVPSKGSSFPDAARNKLERTSRDFVARSSHADYTGNAPSSVSTFQCGSHNFHVSGAIKRVVTAPFGHRTRDMLLNGFVDIFRVDAVSGAESFGNIKFAWVEINPNNLLGARRFCRLDHSKSYSSQSKHSHGRIGFDLACVLHGAKSCRYTTTEEANFFEWRLIGNLSATNLGKDSIFRHCRASHEVEDFFAILVFEALSPVWHDTLALGTTNRRAQVGLGRSTKYARSLVALRCVARNDLVTGFHSSDTFPNRFHNTSSLMAQDTRKQSFGVQTIQRVNIRVAKSIRHDLDSNLASLGGINSDFFHT
mmetsp:Transcript_24842/g.68805  ORF Transcript_24842/g.68805 Transcript_24842/m.68805 type:complete len:349 (-) Transcript_24842:252-1298(-)